MAQRKKTAFEATILSPQGAAWEMTKVSLYPEKVPSLPQRCYVFIRKNDYRSHREMLLKLFEVPMFVANRTCTDLNGYFGCRVSYEDSYPKRVAVCSTWFRCLVKMVRKESKGPHDEETEYVIDPHDEEPEYVGSDDTKGYVWFEMGIFTIWKKEECKVLCVDTPFDLPGRLKEASGQSSSEPEFRDPFVMHTDLLDQIILYYDISVWRVRDPVREQEKSRGHLKKNAFKVMHDLSRHAIHTSEVLVAMIETIRELQRYQIDIRKSLCAILQNNYVKQAQAKTDFQIQLIQSLKLRSESNQRRLENEVNLAFNNLVHQDNTVMKSIALLTMVFLPTTFFSALFSTTFFTYGTGGWEVSSRLWIYFAITVPVTIVVVIMYLIWFCYGQISGLRKVPGRESGGRSKGWHATHQDV